ncbi:RNA-binding protein 39 [Polyplax serrata]|uniref:RNA-binding protein 39 n=1 Tax=Polyplax serrata TaxID=468196 RepID=A0ABR1AZ89_POLSC
MTEELDVEAMLEAPFQKHKEEPSKSGKEQNGKDRDRGRDRDRDRSREREKDREKRSKRDRSRSREHDKRDRKDRDRREKRSRDRGRHSRDRDGRSRDRDRHSRERDRHSRDRDRHSRERDRYSRDRDRHSRDRDRDRYRSRRRSISPNNLAPHLLYNEYASKNKPPMDDLTPEERDQRTVFCMQLSQRIRGRDLEEFFSSVGKVRDVKLITCNKTRRFKGIAYVEFKDPESVPLAMGLTGQKLLGIPISVQPTQAEKNRQGNTTTPMMMPSDMKGPMRLYVGSLHFNITEDMLRGIFEPFGKIDSIQLIMDPETGRSKGYGFITFHSADDAKKALEQLNGFELAGRPMKVGNVQERTDNIAGTSILDTDELDRSGIDLGATGRLQLMYKLAEGTGMQIPPAAANALNLANALPQAVQPAPPIATQCFMLANMFDPATETNPTWDVEIRDDVIEECNKHGGVLHVYVDKTSNGNVYVKCPTIATAVASVNSLHGRWFAGRVITAAYVPLLNYHSHFPDALTAMQLLMPSVPRKT